MDLDIKSFCAVQGAQLISLKIKFRETWMSPFVALLNQLTGYVFLCRKTIPCKFQ